LNPDLGKTNDELFSILLAAATGPWISSSKFAANDERYRTLKGQLLSENELKPLLPEFLAQCPTLTDFSKFIKRQAPTYQERRLYLGRAFRLSNAFFYGSSVNAGDSVISAGLFSRERIREDWEKALQRRATEPEGAITLAKTLLGTTFRHVLDERGQQTSYSSNTDLPELCYKASIAIGNHPQSTQNDQLKNYSGHVYL
jgi:hypothetical protein